MGRYYSGDIEGKFWFALQCSTAGERFGATQRTDIIHYAVDKDDLPQVEEEIKNIENKLKSKIKILDDFLAKNNMFLNLRGRCAKYDDAEKAQPDRSQGAAGAEPGRCQGEARPRPRRGQARLQPGRSKGAARALPGRSQGQPGRSRSATRTQPRRTCAFD